MSDRASNGRYREVQAGSFNGRFWAVRSRMALSTHTRRFSPSGAPPVKWATDLARKPRRRSPSGAAVRYPAIQGSGSHIAVAREHKTSYLIAPPSLNNLDSDDLPKPDRRGPKTNV